MFAASYFSDNWTAHTVPPTYQTGMTQSRKTFCPVLNREHGELIKRVASFVDDSCTWLARLSRPTTQGPRHHNDFTRLTNRIRSTMAMIPE